MSSTFDSMTPIRTSCFHEETDAHVHHAAPPDSTSPMIAWMTHIGIAPKLRLRALLLGTDIGCLRWGGERELCRAASHLLLLHSLCVLRCIRLDPDRPRLVSLGFDESALHLLLGVERHVAPTRKFHCLSETDRKSVV